MTEQANTGITYICQTFKEEEEKVPSFFGLESKWLSSDFEKFCDFDDPTCGGSKWWSSRNPFLVKKQTTQNNV